MKYIPLTQGKFSLVDDDDFEAVNAFKWQASKKKNGLFYATRVDTSTGVRKQTSIHQMLMPRGRADHKDGDGLNNQRSNLRPCTIQQNNQNTAVKSGKKGSVYKGVQRYWNKWRAEIKHSGKRVRLGAFNTEVDAAVAYDLAAKKFFGEFARTNF